MRAILNSLVFFGLACGGTSSGTHLADPVEIQQATVEITPERLLPPETKVLMTVDVPRMRASQYLDPESPIMLAFREAFPPENPEGETSESADFEEDIEFPWEGIGRISIAFIASPEAEAANHQRTTATPSPGSPSNETQPNNAPVGSLDPQSSNVASPASESEDENDNSLNENDIFFFVETTRSAREIERTVQEWSERQRAREEAEAEEEAEEVLQPSETVIADDAEDEEPRCYNVEVAELFAEHAALLQMSEGLQCENFIAVTLGGEYLVLGTNERLQIEFARLVNESVELTSFPSPEASRVLRHLNPDSMISIVGQHELLAEKAEGLTAFAAHLDFMADIELGVVGAFQTDAQAEVAHAALTTFRAQLLRFAGLFASRIDLTTEVGSMAIEQNARDVSATLHIPAVRVLEIIQEVIALSNTTNNPGTSGGQTAAGATGTSGTAGSSSANSTPAATP